jgi:hypothetical protein
MYALSRLGQSGPLGETKPVYLRASLLQAKISGGDFPCPTLLFNAG